jgi:hypothetical protein
MAEHLNQCYFNSQQRQENFFFSTMSRTTQRPTQSLILWVPGALSKSVNVNVATCHYLFRLRMLYLQLPMSTYCKQGQVYLCILEPASGIGICTPSVVYSGIRCLFAFSVLTVVSFLYRQLPSGCSHF